MGALFRAGGVLLDAGFTGVAKLWVRSACPHAPGALVPLCFAVLLAPAAAQGPADRRERFQLFNACRPVRIVIEGLNAEAHAIGLTKADLQASTESSLHSACLYTESEQVAQGAYLYVNVNVATPAFSTRPLSMCSA